MSVPDDRPDGGTSRPTDGVAASDAVAVVTIPTRESVLATGVAPSFRDYLRAWWVRVRSGDAGILPVIGALVGVTIVFQVAGPKGLFLSPANLVNLFIQSSVFMVLAMAQGFVLLLGEIDLSIGYVGAVGGIVAATLVQPGAGWPWWGAIAAGLVVGALIGALDGIVITGLRLPSIVVTLAGYLLWFGVMLIILGPAGAVSISSPVLYDQGVIKSIVQGTIDPTVGWIALAVLIVVLGSAMWVRDAGRRRNGLVAPPVGLTVAKIVLMAVIGIAVVAICNVDRGRFLPIQGVPWVVPLVLVVAAVWTVVLERTAFGRHVYAVGGNAEAARRAGIDVSRVRIWCFVLCSFTAVIAGIIYCAWQGGMTTNINGGQLVLYAIAAAVIGGTSLFGGRGRAIHGLLGGLVIGAIYNGLYLLGLDIQWQLIATALVLLGAVTVDALSRRGTTSGNQARG